MTLRTSLTRKTSSSFIDHNSQKHFDRIRLNDTKAVDHFVATLRVEYKKPVEQKVIDYLIEHPSAIVQLIDQCIKKDVSLREKGSESQTLITTAIKKLSSSELTEKQRLDISNSVQLLLKEIDIEIEDLLQITNQTCLYSPNFIEMVVKEIKVRKYNDKDKFLFWTGVKSDNFAERVKDVWDVNILGEEPKLVKKEKIIVENISDNSSEEENSSSQEEEPFNPLLDSVTLKTKIFANQEEQKSNIEEDENEKNTSGDSAEEPSKNSLRVDNVSNPKIQTEEIAEKSEKQTPLMHLLINCKPGRYQYETRRAQIFLLLACGAHLPNEEELTQIKKKNPLLLEGDFILSKALSQVEEFTHRSVSVSEPSFWEKLWVFSYPVDRDCHIDKKTVFKQAMTKSVLLWAAMLSTFKIPLVEKTLSLSSRLLVSMVVGMSFGALYYFVMIQAAKQAAKKAYDLAWQEFNRTLFPSYALLRRLLFSDLFPTVIQDKDIDDLNCVTDQGITFFNILCDDNRLDLPRFGLLVRKTFGSKQDEEKNFLFLQAVAGNHSEYVDFLLENKHGESLTDNDKFRCFIDCGKIETIEVLKRHGLDSKVKNSEGCTPLFYLLENKFVGVLDLHEHVEALLEGEESIPKYLDLIGKSRVGNSIKRTLSLQHLVKGDSKLKEILLSHDPECLPQDAPKPTIDPNKLSEGYESKKITSQNGDGEGSSGSSSDSED